MRLGNMTNYKILKFYLEGDLSSATCQAIVG